MIRLIFIIVSVSLTAMSLPKLYIENQDLIHRALDGENASAQSAQSRQSSPVRRTSANPLAGRQVRLEMDNRGHFTSEFKLNGRRIEALVDTGATYVAINNRLARRIGLHLAQSDFKYPVNTANGQVMAAAAHIEDMRIGRIRVTNVEAAVLPDRALDGVLVGMSFLKRLGRFEIEGRTLILQQ